MARTGRPRSDVGTRLRRVLVMLPWLLEEGGSTVGEIARRFDVDEDDVVRDLNLVMCCGLPPYGGGDLITVVLDEDGSVEAWPGPFFSRPMQLTPTEGFEVLTAGRTLLAVPGEGARVEGLASALDKLEAALGASGSLAVDLEAPPLLGVVRGAAERCERLAVTYYSAWRDELSDRVVEPLLVHSRDGRWYAEVLDVTGGGGGGAVGVERRLRVDRVQSAVGTGESFVPPAGGVARPDEVFSPSPSSGMTEVTVVLPLSARWMTEVYAVESVEELGGDGDDGGGLRVRLYVAGERFLERMLLKAGPGARVESPAALVGTGRRVADRVLARYR